MELLFKVRNKRPSNDPNFLKGWRDGQLIDIRADGFHDHSNLDKINHCVIKTQHDFWKLRGSTDWKSTIDKVHELKKFLVPVDSEGKYPWERIARLDEKRIRPRDWFIDFKKLLDLGWITKVDFESIYDVNKKHNPIYIDRDLTSYLAHEDVETRLSSIYSNEVNRRFIAAGTYSIGAAQDYATVTAFEAAIDAQLTGNLTGEHNNEQTTTSAAIIFDTDTNTHLLKLTAQLGDEHNGGAYGNGARVSFGAADGIQFDETTAGHLADIEVSKIAFSAANNLACVAFNDCGDSGGVKANRLLCECGGINVYGISCYGSGVENVTITNNICYNADYAGIVLNTAGRTYFVGNNTCQGCGKGFFQNHATGATGLTFKNNLAQGNTVDYSDDGAGWGTHSKNISEDATGPDAAYDNTDVHTNSVFKNYAADDFRLDSAGNAANLAIVDDGDDLSGTFTDDIEGQTRSTWYIGASEIVAAGGEEHVKNLSDTINLSDAHIFLSGLNRSDLMSLSDSGIKNIDRPLTDSISMSDGIAKNVGWSEADSITMSDGIAKTPGLPKADTITLSDNASMVASFLRSLNDTINLSDDMVKSYRTTKADIVTMSDSVAKLFGLSINDVTSLSEIIVKQIGTPKADSITLSDDITKNFGVTKSDTITLSDNLVSIIITLILNLNDTINLSDDIVKNVGTARADTINISDNFSKVIAYLRSFADTITLSDLGLREAGLNKTDTITISDGIAKTPGLSSADTITLSENIAKELGLNKTDTITLSDFFSSDAGGALLFIIEQLGLSPISGIF